MDAKSLNKTMPKMALVAHPGFMVIEITPMHSCAAVLRNLPKSHSTLPLGSYAGCVFVAACR